MLLFRQLGHLSAPVLPLPGRACRSCLLRSYCCLVFVSSCFLLSYSFDKEPSPCTALLILIFWMCLLGEAQRGTVAMIMGAPHLQWWPLAECRLAGCGVSRVCGLSSVLCECTSLEAPFAQVLCAVAHLSSFSPELSGMILKWLTVWKGRRARKNPSWCS